VLFISTFLEEKRTAIKSTMRSKRSGGGFLSRSTHGPRARLPLVLVLELVVVLGVYTLVSDL